MQKLKINLENCYGIKDLKYCFDFNNKNSYIIYSPNGTMKTSFAKSFKDFSFGNVPKDLIFPDKITLFNIQNESEETIKPEDIFVIEPYNSGYESDKMFTLLVNKELKKEYDQIHINIDKKKDFLLKELKQLSKLNKNIEETISYDIMSDSTRFFGALMRLQDEVENEVDESLIKVNYNLLFNEKVQNFLNTKDFKGKLENYIKIYDELISNSTFFSRGNFDHYNASNVEKSLKDNKFFIAKHSVYINQQGIKKEITSDKELEEAINIEKSKILENEDLKNAFSEIDKAIKNKELVEFRNYILENQYLLTKLKNIKKLKQDIWVAYLSERKDTYNDVINTYKESREKLREIAEQAEKEITKWQSIINIFNERFYVPFNVKIENKISGDILYIDPPYNNRQYCPNYHVLETIAMYDFPILKGITGQRDYQNKKSSFCNKTSVLKTFEDLVKKAKFKHIILSYSNEGLMSIADIEKILKKYGQKGSFKMYEIPYRRFKSSRKSSNKDLKELLFYIRKENDC